MGEPRRPSAARRRGGTHRLIFLVALATIWPLTGAGSPAEGVPLPWEVWHGPEALARVPTGDRVVTVSSRCAEECRYDRHSPDHPRWLRSHGGEAVIFDRSGSGAVTRIWMTTGHGISEPLPDGVRVRVRLDGADTPVLDLALPELFSGRVPPFVSPLVADRTLASGGNVSYVLIPFRSRCIISLLGAEETTLWFQVTAHLLDGPEGVRTFGGGDELGAWSDLLARAGGNPWTATAYPVTASQVELRRGASERAAVLRGPAMINGLLVRAPRWSWPWVRLRLSFDGAVTVDLPLAELFGADPIRGGDIRSLLVGVTDDDDLYCYFPMPFEREAVVELVRPRVGPRRRATVEVAVRRGASPAERPAPFTAVPVEVSDPDEDDGPAVLVDVAGRGRLVGIIATVGGRAGERRDYLEGDEEVWVDGRLLWQGTGVEDFFGGGFYFRIDDPEPVPFRHPLHGMVADTGDGDPATTMYRLLLVDGPVFSERLRFLLERGPVGDTPIRVDGVAFLYLDP